MNTRLDELSRLIESEYESNKAISIFQYFDKIYTLCYGTSNLSTLMDTLIQKKYTGMSPILPFIIRSEKSFFKELCYPIFRRIHTDVFKNQQSWHVTYYLLHSLWNYTDKSNGMCIVRRIMDENVAFMIGLDFLGCGGNKIRSSIDV